MKKFVLFLIVLCGLSACKYKSLNEMLKEIAVQQVDTTGYSERVVYPQSFTTVAVNCFSDVTYHQTALGEKPYVVLRAPENVLQHTECIVVDDESLRIELKPPYRQPESVAFVINVYAPVVDRFVVNGGKCLRLGKIKRAMPLSVEMNGCGSILCDQLVAPDFEAELNGAGHIELRNIEVNRIKATINSIGNIVLSGKAKNTSLKINGEGKIDTNSLIKL